jgi:hypothetical protein
MLKKTIKYTDYNNVEREEDFYFNLTEAELLEMEMGTTGGLTEMAKKMVATKDAPGLIKLFKDLVLIAYGEKSADGRRFMKSQEIRDNFAQTPAYSILFMELATDDKAGAAFVNGIVPADLAAKANAVDMQNHPALKK